MATTTSVNGQTVVHETSDGVLNTSPDVCLTPVGSAIVPIPYSNVAFAKDTSNGSKTVTVDGNPIMLKESVFYKSTGDEPGVAKGISSGTTGSVAKFVNYSFDVMVEGRNVCRRMDLMTSNKGNTPPASLKQPNVITEGLTGKHLLPITFVFRDPDLISGKIRQPIFETLNTVEGPETFRQPASDYTGALHPCEQPDGEYAVIFDEFNLEEDSFE
jgi:ribosomal protein L24